MSGTRVKKIRLEQDVQDILDVIDTTGIGSKFLNDAGSYEEVSGGGGGNISSNLYTVLPEGNVISKNLIGVERDGTHYYVMNSDNIYKLNSSFEIVATFTETSIQQMLLHNGFIYTIKKTVPTAILKIDTATMTISNTLPTGWDIGNICLAGDYIIAARSNGGNFYLYRINIATFLVEAQSAAQLTYGVESSMCWDGTYLYCNHENSGLGIRKIDISTLTSVGLYGSSFACYNLIYNNNDGYVYFDWSSNNTIVKLDTTTMTVIYIGILKSQCKFCLLGEYMYGLIDARSIDFLLVKFDGTGLKGVQDGIGGVSLVQGGDIIGAKNGYVFMYNDSYTLYPTLTYAIKI